MPRVTVPLATGNKTVTSDERRTTSDKWKGLRQERQEELLLILALFAHLASLA